MTQPRWGRPPVYYLTSLCAYINVTAAGCPWKSSPQAEAAAAAQGSRGRESGLHLGRPSVANSESPTRSRRSSVARVSGGGGGGGGRKTSFEVRENNPSIVLTGVQLPTPTAPNEQAELCRESELSSTPSTVASLCLTACRFTHNLRLLLAGTLSVWRAGCVVCM